MSISFGDSKTKWDASQLTKGQTVVFRNCEWTKEDYAGRTGDEQWLDRDSSWVPDEQVTICFHCSKSFDLSRRKHHCRRCGLVFCDDCSDNKVEGHRVCNICLDDIKKQRSQGK